MWFWRRAIFSPLVQAPQLVVTVLVCTHVAGPLALVAPGCLPTPYFIPAVPSLLALCVGVQVHGRWRCKQGTGWVCSDGLARSKWAVARLNSALDDCGTPRFTRHVACQAGPDGARCCGCAWIPLLSSAVCPKRLTHGIPAVGRALRPGRLPGALPWVRCTRHCMPGTESRCVPLLVVVGVALAQDTAVPHGVVRWLGRCGG